MHSLLEMMMRGEESMLNRHVDWTVFLTTRVTQRAILCCATELTRHCFKAYYGDLFLLYSGDGGDAA